MLERIMNPITKKKGQKVSCKKMRNLWIESERLKTDIDKSLKKFETLKSE